MLNNGKLTNKTLIRAKSLRHTNKLQFARRTLFVVVVYPHTHTKTRTSTNRVTNNTFQPFCFFAWRRPSSLLRHLPYCFCWCLVSKCLRLSFLAWSDETRWFNSMSNLLFANGCARVSRRWCQHKTHEHDENYKRYVKDANNKHLLTIVCGDGEWDLLEALWVRERERAILVKR